MSADADLLRLEYVPISRAVQWDENPKKHDLAALVDSIYRYGFQDPPKYDSALGALIFGNGRTAALKAAQTAGRQPPRGVMLDQTSGEWCIPVLFGNDLYVAVTLERWAQMTGKTSELLDRHP